MAFFIDTEAATLIRQLSEARGFSPEDFADAIADWAKSQGPGWTRGTVDAFTIRRLFRTGRVPQIRVRFVLAQFFDMQPHEIWREERRVRVETDRRRRVRVAA